MFPALPRALALLALLVLAPAAAPAQTLAPGADTARVCPAVPDTSRFIPTRQQLREREEMRSEIRAVARRHGISDPRGLIYTRVDSTRKGRALFLETNLSEPVAREAVQRIEAYLDALEGGRSFQGLVRIGGTEAVMAAGKRHCPPVLLNAAEVGEVMGEISSRRPPAMQPDPTVQLQRARLWLVVNREGGVSHVEVDRLSGDAYMDALLPQVGAVLKFSPATLDGVPFDVRIRYTLP